MAEPPDQSTQVIPADFKWPEPAPLDTKRYTPELTPVFDFPAAREARDHTGSVGGYEGAEGRTHQDVLTDLSRDDQLRLLKDNNIDLQSQDDGGLASMRAYTLGKTLEPANRFGVRIARVTCRPDDGNRRDGQSISYSETTSNLQRQTVTSSSAGLGVPGIFKLDASFSQAVATAERSRSVRIFFQASQVIPKARVSVEEEDISLAPALVARIRQAVEHGRAEELLDVLRDNGHFVPTSIILGGRITLHDSTEIDDASSFSAVERKFKAAADAQFTAEGVPVSAGGGAGHGSTDRAESSSVQQSKKLEMELKGGIESLGSSQAGTLGTKWIDSVGSFQRWRTIGFAPHSLVPITEFLEPALRDAALDLLRSYFRGKLRVVRTDLAGSDSDDAFGPDRATLARVRRISEIVVNHGINVDGLAWTHEVQPEPGRPLAETVGHGDGQGFGRWRGERTDTITLDPDERVVAIEAACEPGEGLRRIAIRTTKGRYPDTAFFGRDPKATDVRVIQAPRTVGFHGFKATLVHGLGLSHLVLGTDTHSPEFLEQIEPLLFPTRDYGSIRG